MNRFTEKLSTVLAVLFLNFTFLHAQKGLIIEISFQAIQI